MGMTGSQLEQLHSKKFSLVAKETARLGLPSSAGSQSSQYADCRIIEGPLTAV